MRVDVRYYLIIVALLIISVIGEISAKGAHDIVVKSLTSKIAALEGQVADRDAVLKTVLGREWEPSDTKQSVVVDVTMYTSRREECGEFPYITASGSLVRPNTVAVSPNLMRKYGLFMGQMVFLENYGLFIVTSKTSESIRDTVDIWVGDLKLARLHGRQKARLTWFVK